MTREAPTLSELLDDPIIRIMMERDGVDPEEIRRLLETLMSPKPPSTSSSKERSSPFAYALRGFGR